MSGLTDILIAHVQDVPAIISEWPDEKQWSAIEATGVDGLVLEELAEAMGRPNLASAIQDLEPSSIDEESGPWVYVLPLEFREHLAALSPEEFRSVSKAWCEGEETSGRGLTQEIAEDLLHQLCSLAVRARREDRSFVLWVSL